MIWDDRYSIKGVHRWFYAAPPTAEGVWSTPHSHWPSDHARLRPGYFYFLSVHPGKLGSLPEKQNRKGSFGPLVTLVVTDGRFDLKSGILNSCPNKLKLDLKTNYAPLLFLWYTKEEVWFDLQRIFLLSWLYILIKWKPYLFCWYFYFGNLAYRLNIRTG